MPLLLAGLAGGGVGVLLAHLHGAGTGCPAIGKSWPFMATARRGTSSAYDQQWRGIPLLDRPAPDFGASPAKVLSRFPFQGPVQLVCGPIATPWPGSPPISLYWGVQGGGFVHDWDLDTAPDR